MSSALTYGSLSNYFMHVASLRACICAQGSQSALIKFIEWP